MANATANAGMPTAALPDGTAVPQLGQGTWTMGEHKARASVEASALAVGFELGMTLVDTAEMYGDGGAEEVVARAMAGRRDRLFVVSKVYPHNAGRRSAIQACERSLKRLGTDRLDLYLCIGGGAFRSARRSRRSNACARMARSFAGASPISIRRTCASS
jgi:diketogulonate reductase-like aldo/keto reductase